ncbi:hypothetical protein JZ751_016800 [Albula glossodonta]|uniref:Uncharacterized protein n=1 Tax=Albula glossodonta TaxID=121402 RepID=A0A8T2NXY3_9TELE|nr:hypothetical protein JZ751_016800 [Albula glossodonta]
MSLFSLFKKVTKKKTTSVPDAFVVRSLNVNELHCWLEMQTIEEQGRLFFTERKKSAPQTAKDKLCWPQTPHAAVQLRVWRTGPRTEQRAQLFPLLLPAARSSTVSSSESPRRPVRRGTTTKGALLSTCAANRRLLLENQAAVSRLGAPHCLLGRGREGGAGCLTGPGLALLREAALCSRCKKALKRRSLALD